MAPAASASAANAVAASLSTDEARRVALAAQGLRGPRPSGGPAVTLRRLGGVQLDTISVLARSHELVAYARHGPIPRQRIEASYWGPRSATFEYWSHAACLLPLEEWPTYAFKRRARRARGRRWHQLEDQAKTCAEVTARLRAEGPLTARELGGAKRGGPWWDWSEIKIAAEWLLDTGELVCRQRRGFQRVYDLADRAVPDDLRGQEPSDAECVARLVGSAGRALGVATVDDLAAYHGVPARQVPAALEGAGLVPVEVDGWAKTAFADPVALEVLGRRLRGRTVLLSPFDSLTWYRPRTERLFGLRHRLEAYTPRHKRLFGYFAMPVLAGTEMVGLVDPGRRGRTLVAKQVTLLSAGATTPVASALREAAAWVGSDAIAVERVEPPERRSELVRAVE
ncbi:MAG: winged helix-turn-helix domain-containing protein [Acidimicrobiales bacterium]